jgi:hypothetical protein
MFGPIVVHVAALAEGGEVFTHVVRRVVIAVPGRQNQARGAHASQNVIGPHCQTDEAPGPIAPGAHLSIPPAPIAKMKDALSMRTGADLTTASCPLEANDGRELRPVDGIEEVVLAPDWHQEDAFRVAAAARSTWLRVRVT